MLLFLSIIIALILFAYIFMRTPAFGAFSSGKKRERNKRSPNFREGSFQNQHFTPTLTEGTHMTKVLWEFLFHKKSRLTPKQILPHVKTDLHTISPEENVLVWFGHSSYYLQVDGKKILVDPVLNGYASPFSFTTNAFKGTDVYEAKDFPEIDYLFISHDHWDHLSYPTIMSLKPKIKKIITGLGNAAHFERWGFEIGIIEKDWYESASIDNGFSVTFLPARHFSGRTFRRNQSLWVSFVLNTPHHKIYLGGDSGYDTHFAETGKNHGPFDLAILECGQYNQNWKYIHMMPEETVQAAIDLRGKYILPVHWSKFVLAQHPWDEPINRATAAANDKNVPILHPMIGEKLDIDRPALQRRWWDGID